MSVQEMHLARRQLAIAHANLVRAYEKASQNWPEMATVAAQSALCQAHTALIPVAFALGRSYGSGFCASWDAALASIQRQQRERRQAALRARRLEAAQRGPASRTLRRKRHTPATLSLASPVPQESVA